MKQVFFALLLLLMSCSTDEKLPIDNSPGTTPDTTSDAVTSASAKAAAWLPEPGETYTVIGAVTGIKGFVVQYNDSLYRGGDLLADAGARQLKQRGVKTVLSITPNANIDAYAAAYGLSVMKLPFDYQGLSAEDVKTFVGQLKGAEYPLYIHCHSGKQRGGNLCAIARASLEGWSLEKAMAEYGALGGKVDDDRAMLTSAIAGLKQL